MTLSTPQIVINDLFIEDPNTLYCRLQEQVNWDTRMKARKTASVGVPYKYSGLAYPHTTMLPVLTPVCEAIRKIFGYFPNNCLLNYYPEGESTMGYHSDDTEQLVNGTGVAIVSLGAERTIVFRNKSNKAVIHHYTLKNGSLLFMSKVVQDNWQHAIPKTPDAGPRISLTFRAVVNSQELYP